jgi:hypothetical protein
MADITHVSGGVHASRDHPQPSGPRPPAAQQDTASTSFTGEFRDVIRSGIPGKPSMLTLGDIYPELRQRLRSKGLPIPSQRGTDTAHQFPFSINIVGVGGSSAVGASSLGTRADDNGQPVSDEDSTARRTGMASPGSRSGPAGHAGSTRMHHIDLLESIAEEAQSITGRFSESHKAVVLSEVAVVIAAIATDRAERIARSIVKESKRDTCLKVIAETAPPAEAALAERIARSITVDSYQAEALGSVSMAIIAADPEHAIEIARSIMDEDYRQRIMAEIAAAMVVTDLERGERLARSLSRPARKAQALALVAAAVAAANPGHAALLAADAEKTAAEDSAAKANVACALAASDLSRAERIARSITDTGKRIWVLEYVARAAVAAGSLDRAESIGKTISLQAMASVGP